MKKKLFALALMASVGIVSCSSDDDSGSDDDMNGQNCVICCLLYTSPSPRDKRQSRMPSSA